MVITEDTIKEKFRKFNSEYFGKALPLPKFTLLHSYRYLGSFMCDKIIGNRKLKHPELQIFDYYD